MTKTLKQARRERGLTQAEVAEMLGMTQASYSRYEAGSQNISYEAEERLRLEFPEALIKKKQQKTEVTITTDEYMELPVISINAEAGYLDSIMNDRQDSYTNELRTLLVPKEFEKGNYLVVEVKGDSMDDNSGRAIQHGDKILVKELPRGNWQYKLHYRNYLFVFVTKEGIILKQVVDHDVSTGEITLRSWNDFYEDYKINIQDCLQIFYVKKIVEKQIRL